MAKHDDNHSRLGEAASAVAQKERAVSDIAADHDNHDDESYERSSPASYAPAASSRGGFFDIYKLGQGYHTRVWSAIGYGALVLWFAYFLFDKLSVIDAGNSTLLIQVGAVVAVIIGFGLLGYWLLGLNRRVGDFLIATEGEMKKVSWSSRKEIIGSTKVVIFVRVFMAVLLFVVDLFFIMFFNAIGVLKGTSMLDAFREIFR